MPSHMGRATQTCLLVPRADTHTYTHTRGWDVHRSATQTCFLVPRVDTHIQPKTQLVSGLRHNLFKEKIAKDGRHI